MIRKMVRALHKSFLQHFWSLMCLSIIQPFPTLTLGNTEPCFSGAFSTSRILTELEIQCTNGISIVDTKISLDSAESECSHFNLSNPDVVSGPACDSSCNIGEYLSFEAEKGIYECRPCDIGTFSVGGGSLFQNWNSSFTPSSAHDMETKCFYLSESLDSDIFRWIEGINCNTWTVSPDGRSINSGNNSNLHSIESYIVLQQRFLQHGRLWFRFTVDAEPNADGLMFFIDNRRMVVSEDYFEYLASQQRQARTLSFDVEAGWHTFKWVYMKDNTYEEGLDAATITEIGYTGTTLTPYRCTPCPVGTTSGLGAGRCSPCAADYVYDAQTAACVQCPEGSYADIGADTCEPRPACGPDDWVVEEGEIWRGGSRGCQVWRGFGWRQPKLCYGGMDLPENQTGLTCPECPPGAVRGSAGPCEWCPDGTFRPPASSACSRCEAGRQAPKHEIFEDFKRWPEGLSSGCSGACAGSRGWRLRQDHLEPSAVGAQAEEWLQLLADLDGPGGVALELSWPCQPWKPGSSPISSQGIGRLVLLANGSYLTEVACGGDYNVTSGSPAPAQSKQRWERQLPAGRSLLRLSYSGPAASGGGLGGDYGDIRSPWVSKIDLWGTARGGAVDCLPCPSGRFSGGGVTRCAACSAGMSSLPGSGWCFTCPAGTVAPAPASPTCRACGPGTHAAPGAVLCVGSGSGHLPCGFSARGADYDLSPLADRAWGPVRVGSYSGGLQGGGLVLAMCGPLPRNHSCLATSGDSGWVRGQAYACLAPLQTAAGTSATDGGAQEMQGPGLAAGRIMGFSALPWRLQGVYDSGLTVTFVGGDVCGDGSGESWGKEDMHIDTDGLTYKVVVHVVCDLSAGEGQPAAIAAKDVGDEDAGECHIELIWRSKHGCPLCTQASFKMLASDCVAGYRDVSFQRLKDCYGGWTPPGSGRVQACIAALPDVLPSWALLLIAVAAASLTACLGWLSWRFVTYRRLYSQYAKLATRMGDDGDDESNGRQAIQPIGR